MHRTYKDSMSGSQRDRQINVRVTEDERDFIIASARRLGMTVGQYLRWTSIYEPKLESKVMQEVQSYGHY